jgi:hypothetical protein
MRFNVYGVFCSQFSHQHVSAAVAAIQGDNSGQNTLMGKK